jgi:TolA-binding protein
MGLGAVGCKKDKTQAEMQAEKVKVFRERQKKAAARAYQDIVEKYPDSSFAEQAKQKVQELGGPPAATPEKK